MTSPIPFIEIIINLLRDLDKRGISYEDAIKELEGVIQIIEKSLEDIKKRNNEK